jgi:peroxiredoxin Q/BCP
MSRIETHQKLPLTKGFHSHPVSFTAVIFLTMISFSSFLRASDPSPVGSPAPEIVAVDQDGKEIDLSSVFSLGTTLVYFYPKADTSGCTAQACSLRDSIEELKNLGITVIGVSKDSPEAQKRFQEKYELPFTLIADQDGKVARAFGVGSILGFTARSSFLVRDGKIVWAQPKAKTAGHAVEVKAALASLEPQS